MLSSGLFREDLLPHDNRPLTYLIIRWHWHLNDVKYVCEDHDKEGRVLIAQGWDHEAKMNLRAYPCVECLAGVLLAGKIPYAATGTKVYGLAPPENGPDLPTAVINGVAIGGSQGK